MKFFSPCSMIISFGCLLNLRLFRKLKLGGRTIRMVFGSVVFLVIPNAVNAQSQDISLMHSSGLMLGILALLLIFILLYIRQRRITAGQHKRLNEAQKEISQKKIEIEQAKDKLQEQINYSDEQNELIHQQTIELEKHRHHLERTVDMRTSELKVAKEKAEEANRLKTAFLENISHEVRTPMNAIMGFSNLLNALDLSEEDRNKYISRITTNSNILLQLMEDIITMSKLQAGQTEVIKDKFSVKQLLLDLFKHYNHERTQLGLSELELDLDLPEHPHDYELYSDPFHVKRVLTHLLSNALKYCEKGKITFGYKPLFSSSYDKEPDALQFFVSDTGIGIPPKKINIIFDSFSKAAEDTTKLYRGAGLGLYISKQLINLLGGRIWVNSTPGKGSTFYFSLPYFDTSDTKKPKEKKQVRKKKKSENQYDWRNKMILIVEDEQNNIILLSEIIRRTGAKIVEARNGLLAVEKIRSERSIDLVLMDLMMPEMDGYEATRKIKKIRPTLPIIAQTAYSDVKQKEKSLELGCDGYIAKPYDPPELLMLIDNFI